MADIYIPFGVKIGWLELVGVAADKDDDKFWLLGVIRLLLLVEIDIFPELIWLDCHDFEEMRSSFASFDDNNRGDWWDLMDKKLLCLFSNF